MFTTFIIIKLLMYVLFTMIGASTSTANCNATVVQGWSAGVSIIRVVPAETADACCKLCTAEGKCITFVLSGEKCYLKGDADGGHAKEGNTCGYVRAQAPVPIPVWEVVEATPIPLLDATEGAKYNIYSGFETGQYQRIDNMYYLTVNELGMCENQAWNQVTRAALWSAPNSTGPWTRITTLRNGSHMYSDCKNTDHPYPDQENETNFVTWTPQLLHANSVVNTSGQDVWQLFYSSNQERDGKFNGISWAVSTTDSIAGPYVDVYELPDGTELPQAVVVNYSHSFAAWTLPNGSWIGMKNNIPGAASFSAGLIAPVDRASPGGVWVPIGPNIAHYNGSNTGLGWAPENPYITAAANGQGYYAVFDALYQPAADPINDHSKGTTGAVDSSISDICQDKDKCDRIGVAWSEDGVTWSNTALVPVQTDGNHPCGQLRTPLGLVAEPELCKGCYSVLFTGILSPDFRPLCHAIIRNVNEQ